MEVARMLEDYGEDGQSYEYYACVKNSKIYGTTVDSNYVGGLRRKFRIICCELRNRELRNNFKR